MSGSSPDLDRALLEEKIRSVLDRERPGYVVVIDDLTTMSFAHNVETIDTFVNLVKHATKLLEDE